MCLFPTLLKNPKYKANKKNGGVIPAVLDERTLYVPIGCQNCIECRKQKSRAWQVRLQEDIKEHRNGKFITLTFSDEAFARYAKEFDIEGYELDNEVATRAVRLFLERWRRRFKKSLRHWFVTELGHKGTENIHLHGIVWTDESLLTVEEIWNSGEIKNGYVWKGAYDKGQLINYVSEKTVNYIIKYVTKVDLEHLGFKSRILTSAGIGKRYTERGDFKNNKFRDKRTDEAYRTRSGHKVGLPIYWRNKIYSDSEREKLWIQKLDKNERWVLGVKIDVGKGDDDYYKALVWAREKNRRLGFGSSEITWEQEQYEQQRRAMKQRQRIERAKDKEFERFQREV